MKKILSIILCLFMLIQQFAIPVHANEEHQHEEGTVTLFASNTNKKVIPFVNGKTFNTLLHDKGLDYVKKVVFDSNNDFYNSDYKIQLGTNYYDDIYINESYDHTLYITVSKSEIIQFGSSCSEMFKGFINLESVEFRNVDGSNVEYMNSMFEGCRNLKSVDFTGFNTENVRFMSNLFKDCENTKQLNLIGLNTSNVQDFDGMFESCHQLETLDLNGVIVESGRHFQNMFKGCWSLKSLDLGHFKTPRAINMSNMFYGCSDLEYLNISNFDTENVTNMQGMFYNCQSLTQLDLSHFNTERVKDMSYMFYYCEQLKTLNISSFDAYQVTNTSGMFAFCKRLETLDFTNFKANYLNDTSYMFEYCESLQTLDLSSFDTKYVTNMKRMFASCKNLYSLNVSNFNTSRVTNMEQMFSYCKKLDFLDISSFTFDNCKDTLKEFFMSSSVIHVLVNSPLAEETLKVYYPHIMYTVQGRDKYVDMCDVTTFQEAVPNSGISSIVFTYFKAPTNISTTDLSLNKDRSVLGWKDGTTYYVSSQDYRTYISLPESCKDLFYFYDANVYTNIDLDQVDTSKVKDMSRMFFGNKKIEYLYLSGFDTSNVTNMYRMFGNCSSLKTINVSSFNTSNVTDMQGMFSGCESVKRLELDGFRTSNVTNMSSMFNECKSLEYVSMKYFDTSNVTTMDYMFENCSSLNELNLRDFDTSSLKWNPSYMFYGCYKVVNSYAGTQKDADKFNSSSRKPSNVNFVVSPHTYGEWQVVTTVTCTRDGLERRTCSECGKIENRIVPSTGHDYATNVVEATCTTNGYTEHKCSKCNDSYKNNEVEKLGHTYTSEIIYPTCTEKGYTKLTCGRCGHIEKKYYKDELGHRIIIDPAVDPTCTETGLTQGKHCSRCGKVTVKQQVVKALGHDTVKTTIVPTCTEEGYTLYECKRCDYEKKNNVQPARGHVEGEFYVVVEPTCTKQGLKQVDCKYCGKPMRQLFMVYASHDYNKQVIAPTCTEQGYTIYTCKTCGKTKNDDYVNPTGHQYGDWIITKEATCEEQGSKEKICSCGHKITETIQALGHNEVVDYAYSPTCTKDGAKQGSHCSRCNKVLIKQVVIPALGHSYKEAVTKPTCTSLGYTSYTCLRCNYNYIGNYVSKTEHKFGGWTISKPATCLKDGEIQRKCTGCDETEKQVLKATGHLEVIDKGKEATCTQSGLTEGKHCSKCNEVFIKQEVIPAKGHVFTNYVSDNNATTTTDGTKTAKCNHCNETNTIVDTGSKLPLYGDVNGDDKVNQLDRLVLARYLAKWNGYEIDEAQLKNLDYNVDGKVNQMDRIILSRHLAGWSGYKTLPLKK